MAHAGVRYKRGIFITFEGPEGSGKSTHAHLFFRFLKRKGYDCIFAREPGGTAVGNKIRKILLKDKDIKIDDVCELFLFEANRAQIVEEVILPALGKGKIVISDRFSDATIAYQGFGARLSIRFIKMINDFAAKNIRPDITILLDVDPKKGLERVLVHRRLDRIESKSMNFHRRVRKGYLSLAKKEPRRIKVFCSSGSIREVQKEIRKAIMKCLSGT